MGMQTRPLRWECKPGPSHCKRHDSYAREAIFAKPRARETVKPSARETVLCISHVQGRLSFAKPRARETVLCKTTCKEDCPLQSHVQGRLSFEKPLAKETVLCKTTCKGDCPLQNHVQGRLSLAKSHNGRLCKGWSPVRMCGGVCSGRGLSCISSNVDYCLRHGH